MKVCVVGAGAVGGLVAGELGSRLGPPDLQLSVLARGATLAALQRDGLKVERAGGAPLVVHPIQASDQPQALGVQDLVVLTVKGPALAAVAPAGGSTLSLIFEVALCALILHPQSRSHQKIWYR